MYSFSFDHSAVQVATTADPLHSPMDEEPNSTALRVPIAPVPYSPTIAPAGDFVHTNTLTR